MNIQHYESYASTLLSGLGESIAAGSSDVLACCSQDVLQGRQNLGISLDSVRISVKSFNFEDCFRENYKQVLTSFMRRGLGRELSEELTQDVFLRIYENQDKYKGAFEHSMHSWIKTIAENIWKNHLRSLGTNKRKGQTHSFDEEISLHLLAPEVNPETHMVADQTKQKLREAMAQLDDEMYACLIFRIYHDLKYEDIARVMKIKLHTVKNLLHRARGTIRDYLQGFN